MRACKSCGFEFEAPNPRQTKCRKDCGRSTQERNAARTETRLRHDLTFIGVDGEGINLPDGTHRYVLLSVGDQSLQNPEGLTFLDIVQFLYAQFEANPSAVFVGFFLGYDFTQWFRTLPYDRAWYLLHKRGIEARKPKSKKRHLPFPVEYEGWQFDILNNRRFKLRRKDGDWMYICDVGGFFQKSFLSVLDPKGWPEPIISQEHYDVIRRGKERRSVAALDAEMVEYNVAENRALAILMAHYNRGLVAADIRLDRDQWFGPGQAAQAWLDNIKAPTSKQHNEVLPGDVHLAALASYYGGWFETFAHGHVPGTTYEYDINSAYPNEIADLPCLLHGKWEVGHTQDYPTGLTLIYCTVNGSDPYVGPLPHRNADGLISHPRKVKGWYFAREIEAAKRAGLIDTVKVDRWYHYRPCPCDAPMADIRQLYLRRLQVGKKTPEGQALKLVYNSAYGKMAQSAGSPKYTCALYASLITSGTRVKILDAIATHPTRTKDLVMIATDGIYFRTPHTRLPLDSAALGLWSKESKVNLTVFLPGVYWDDSTREKIARNAAPSLKSRGVSAAALSSMVTEIDDKFRAFDEWPTCEVTLKFAMTSATQAMARGKWETAGDVGTVTRKLSADPESKRIPIPYTDGDIIRTHPYDVGNPPESVPYDRNLGVREIAESVDGPLDSLFAWALGRFE